RGEHASPSAQRRGPGTVPETRRHRRAAEAAQLQGLHHKRSRDDRTELEGERADHFPAGRTTDNGAKPGVEAPAITIDSDNPVEVHGLLRTLPLGPNRLSASKTNSTLIKLSEETTFFEARGVLEAILRLPQHKKELVTTVAVNPDVIDLLDADGDRLKNDTGTIEHITVKYLDETALQGANLDAFLVKSVEQEAQEIERE
ncbi:unnamed protein product, partial [Amoebophrya sp. A120]